MSELRHSQEHHSAGYLEGVARLVAQIPAVIFTTDTALRVTSAAGRALATLGMDPSATVGTTVYEFLQTDDPTQPTIAACLRALGGEQATVEQTVRDRTFAAQIVPLRDSTGAIEGCLGLAVDVTNAKFAEMALRRSEAHYRALVEEAPVGIFRSSNAGRFLTVNRALVDLLGYEIGRAHV